jgi:hypothetical protein
MSKHSTTSRDPDIIASAKALRRAARRALDLGLKTGTPVYVIKGGEIVDLTRQASGYARGITAVAVREAAATYKTRKSRRKQER